MITDKQVGRLMKLIDTESTFEIAAMKAGMSEGTARKYVKGGQLPSERATAHVWKTREDPFKGAWDEIQPLLETNPGLQAKTLFEYLQRKEPGRFDDGQLRTLQRRMKEWRALFGPGKEVMFPQIHEPGRVCASDFCHLTPLGVTLSGQPFPHLLYHFVLTYSNWETGMLCFSESFESLSEGLQRALWELGGVPKRHRTDRLGAAVPIDKKGELRKSEVGVPGGSSPVAPKVEFHRRYQALLDHYGLSGEKIQARQAHENGDCEQRHYRFRTALDQALMLRGSREFIDRAAYERFVTELFGQVNAGRRKRLCEEKAQLRPLPARALEACTRWEIRVGPSSTIRVADNTYSVPSRLIDARVSVKLYSDRLEVSCGRPSPANGPLVIARLIGRKKSRIDYRDVIDSLVKKPGAFAGYRYRDEMFPSSRFRMAYDRLRELQPLRADREYLKLLQLSAGASEAAVEEAIETLLTSDRFGVEAVRERMEATRNHEGEEWRDGSNAGRRTPAIEIDPVDLDAYDALINGSTKGDASRSTKLDVEIIVKGGA